jgi:REP element-mobilizing transposase RayT
MSEQQKVENMEGAAKTQSTRRDASSTLSTSPASAEPAPAFRFFNPHDEIDHIEGNLPHWRQSGVLYFVTFRTADALPADKLALWNSEKKAWLALHPQPWNAATHEEFQERFPRRIQRWLDAGHGECVLARPDLCAIVEDALQHFHRERYELDEFHVASNHAHALVTPLTGHGLTEIFHSWKSYTAKAINRVIGRTGEFWQQESYDHIVRSPAALGRIRIYIRNHAQRG